MLDALALKMRQLGLDAVAAAEQLAQATPAQKNRALKAAALALRSSSNQILLDNSADMDEAVARGLPNALLDRLKLDAVRIEAMARGLEDIEQLAEIGRAHV